MKKCLAMMKDIAELYMNAGITKEDLKPMKRVKFKQLMLQPAAKAAAGVSHRPAAAKVLKRPAATAAAAAAEVSPRPAAAKVLKRPAAAATAAAAAAAAAEVSPRPAAAEASKRPAAALPPSRQLLKRRAAAYAQGLGFGEEEEEEETPSDVDEEGPIIIAKSAC